MNAKNFVWLILNAVEEIDLRAFYETCRHDGEWQSAFEPSMMITLLLYAYSLGIRSSREIEILCERHTGFKVIAANQVPDHCTISRFRKDTGTVLEDLFKQVLRLCKDAGLIKVGIVALDGSKIKSNAVLEASRAYEHVAQEVKKMFDEPEAKDAEEDRLYGPDKRSDDLPEYVADRTSRKALLATSKQRLEDQATTRAAEQHLNIKERQSQEARAGAKKRRRKPNDPDPTPEDTAKENLADPDSRIMKTRSGYVQGYNSQAVVTEGQITIAAEVTRQDNDVNQLHPMIKATQDNLDDIASGKHLTAKTVLADAGYISDNNLEAIVSEGPEHLIATKKD